MSCDAALAFALHLAAARGGGRLAFGAFETSQPIAVAASVLANPLAREPLFASIVRTAGRLETEADALRHAAHRPPTARLPAQWTGFKTRALQLSELDMQGHLELARRGTDGDLKCILRGISQDLPRKLDAVETAPDGAGQRLALDELFYLLRDNVETLTAPPQPAA